MGDVLSHKHSPVAIGQTYAIKYRARNVHGWSVDLSDSVSILAASVPDQIASPVVTVMNSQNVKFTWLAPPNVNGDNVSEYRINFKKKDGTFVTNLT
jgi:hypothetical protein